MKSSRGGSPIVVSACFSEKEVLCGVCGGVGRPAARVASSTTMRLVTFCAMYVTISCVTGWRIKDKRSGSCMDLGRREAPLRRSVWLDMIKVSRLMERCKVMVEMSKRLCKQEARRGSE